MEKLPSQKQVCKSLFTLNVLNSDSNNTTVMKNVSYSVKTAKQLVLYPAPLLGAQWLGPAELWTRGRGYASVLSPTGPSQVPEKTVPLYYVGPAGKQPHPQAAEDGASTLGTGNKRRKNSVLPSTTRASGPTWGEIKQLTAQAEQILQSTGAPHTLENFFLAMIAQVTYNSKLAKVKGVLFILILLSCTLKGSGMVCQAHMPTPPVLDVTGEDPRLP